VKIVVFLLFVLGWLNEEKKKNPTPNFFFSLLSSLLSSFTARNSRPRPRRASPRPREQGLSFEEL